MIRMIARPMLASVFIIDGVSVLRNPNERATATAPAVSRIAKTAGAPATAAPADAAADAATTDKPDAMSKNVVMALAAAKVGAGALFALGKMPRLSATVLAAAHAPTMVARFSAAPGGSLTSTDTKVVGVATDAALLGALFMAAADTQGKPGLAWRYKHAKGEVAAAMPTIKGEARELKDVLTSTVQSVGKDARNVAGVVEEKSHSASQAVASGIEAGLPKLQEGAKNLQAQAAQAASVASAQVSGAAQRASTTLPDSHEVARRGKNVTKNAQQKVSKAQAKAQKAAAKRRKDAAAAAPSTEQLSAVATDALSQARMATADLRGRAQSAAQEAHLGERAQGLADQAVAKSAPLLDKLRGFVADRTATGFARTEEARARAQAARAAAAGDIKTAKKNVKAAEKAAAAAAAEAAAAEAEARA